MRLGKPVKKSRFWKQAGEKAKPKYITSETVIGQVSPDLILSFFAPKIQDVASLQMERYASDLLDYEQDQQNRQQKQGEAEIDSDGSITTITQKDTPGLEVPVPVPPIFYSREVVEEFVQSAITETSEQFFALKAPVGWKVHANAAKFERLLDEKYGAFRPFMTNHPEVERFIRSVQRKYATGYFSPFRQGDPPIPRSTAIVILFMMQRGGMRWDAVILASVFFLVGLQPWALVAIVSLLHSLLMRRKNRPLKGSTMPCLIPAIPPYYASAYDAEKSPETVAERKYELLLGNVGLPLNSNSSSSIDISVFDTLLLGSGTVSLYTAALLSRAGRKVLVLSPGTDASGCLTLEQHDVVAKGKYKNVPFDVNASNIAMISKQQQILAPALCTTTDCQGGIRFAKIGSSADGHAYEILSIPGIGTERSNQAGTPFVLRGDGSDARTLMEDAATFLGDGWPDFDGSGIGNSTVGAYVQACESMNSSANLYYLSKIIPESVKNVLFKNIMYEECSLRYASSFLDKCFPVNAYTRSLMAGIGMRGENLKPSQASMAAHVTNVCAAVLGGGMHYPVGGPRALARAFANVIEKSGGRIVTGVELKDLLFDEDPTVETAPNETNKPDEGAPPPRCVGVRLGDGRQLRFAAERFLGTDADPAIVSLQGFIDTFVRLLPEDVRSKYKVPRGLPALSERRPVFKVLFALRGSASELDVTGADFYRLPNASLALDVFDSSTGTIECGEIGGHAEKEDTTEEGGSPDILESTNRDPSDADGTRTQASRRRKGHRVKFHTGESWLHISFPSAKDPSFSSRHGSITTCVVTVEADDDFVTAFDTKPKLFVIDKETASTPQEKQRLLDKVTKDLIEVYPQLQGKIDHAEVRGPFRRGLSHNPERYAAKGVRADTPYPRLFVGGSDLTVGESFGSAIVGGWLVANAVIGYKVVDHLFLKKNITSDLDAFLEAPSMPDDEDLAVPLPADSDVTAVSVEQP